MRLGQVPLVQPGVRRQPRYLGQMEDVLSVQVLRDGLAAPGIPVSVTLSEGSHIGETDAAGLYAAPYVGGDMATVRITPPVDVVDMGEYAAQTVDLQGGPEEVVFEMHTAAPPDLIEETKGTVAAIATVVLLTLFGASA